MPACCTEKNRGRGGGGSRDEVDVRLAIRPAAKAEQSREVLVAFQSQCGITTRWNQGRGEGRRVRSRRRAREEVKVVFGWRKWSRGRAVAVDVHARGGQSASEPIAVKLHRRDGLGWTSADVQGKYRMARAASWISALKLLGTWQLAVGSWQRDGSRGEGFPWMLKGRKRVVDVRLAHATGEAPTIIALYTWHEKKKLNECT